MTKYRIVRQDVCNYIIERKLVNGWTKMEIGYFYSVDTAKEYLRCLKYELENNPYITHEEEF